MIIDRTYAVTELLVLCELTSLSLKLPITLSVRVKVELLLEC